MTALKTPVPYVKFQPSKDWVRQAAKDEEDCLSELGGPLACSPEIYQEMTEQDDE